MEPIKIVDNPLTNNFREEFNKLYCELKDLDFLDRVKKSEEISNLQNKIIDNKNQNYFEFCKKLFEKNPLYTPVTITFILDKETENCLLKLHQLLIRNERNF